MLSVDPFCGTFFHHTEDLVFRENIAVRVHVLIQCSIVSGNASNKSTNITKVCKKVRRLPVVVNGDVWCDGSGIVNPARWYRWKGNLIPEADVNDGKWQRKVL